MFCWLSTDLEHMFFDPGQDIARAYRCLREKTLKNKEEQSAISVPNDEDYNLEPNNISVNIETKDFKINRRLIIIV